MSLDPAEGELFLASRFEVSWDGRPVPGVIAVSGLRWFFRESDEGALETVADEVRLERERGTDDAFQAWAETARRAAAGGRKQLLARARKDVLVELLGAGGARASLTLRGSVPRAYLPVAGLDAASSEPAREILVLECESIEPRCA